MERYSWREFADVAGYHDELAGHVIEGITRSCTAIAESPEGVTLTPDQRTAFALLDRAGHARFEGFPWSEPYEDEEPKSPVASLSFDEVVHELRTLAFSYRDAMKHGASAGEHCMWLMVEQLTTVLVCEHERMGIEEKDRRAAERISRKSASYAMNASLQFVCWIGQFPWSVAPRKSKARAV